MSFFKSRVSCPLNLASTFTVMTHNFSEILKLKHCMFWTKRAHQCTLDQFFECSNKSSPNSSCQFWNHKVRVCSNFASLFSVMKDNSSLFISSNLFFGQKEPIEVNYSDFWVVGWKFTKFLMSYKPQIKFSLKFF